VASVPQRSPFRYPGGKTWLIPRIRQWLTALRTPPSELVEPFAGGAIVTLTAVAEGLVPRATMVELDDQVAAVWRTIVDGDGPWLADAILAFAPTLESVREVVAASPATSRDKAFQTIVKNRTFHGGILAPGSAPLKHGENGRGISSRWYASTLAKRILAIHEYRHRLTFIAGDGIQVMRDTAERPDVVYFIDPPYTAAGKKAGTRLYTHFELDHLELFRVTSTVAGDFLMTYDDAPGIHDLARQFDFDTELVAMQNTHLTKMTELLVARDLTWARH
jgi:DNA adenine methylase